MGTKLYVGNLPFTVTSQELGELLAQAGEVVSSSIVTERFSGQSRGFGFVEMGSDEAAQGAISQFNDDAVKGRSRFRRRCRDCRLWALHRRAVAVAAVVSGASRNCRQPARALPVLPPWRARRAGAVVVRPPQRRNARRSDPTNGRDPGRRNDPAQAGSVTCGSPWPG